MKSYADLDSIISWYILCFQGQSCSLAIETNVSFLLLCDPLQYVSNRWAPRMGSVRLLLLM